MRLNWQVLWKTHFFVILTMAIICLGFFLRGYAFNTVPATLYWDEVAMLVDARFIAETGRDLHNNLWLQPLFISYGDFKLPVYIWLTALASMLIESDAAVRVPNLLAGIGSLIVTAYLAVSLTKKDFDIREKFSIEEKLLFLATLLVQAISPWAIHFSRTGFEAFMSQFLLSLSALIIINSRRRPLLLGLGVLFGSLATYTYFSTRFVWPVVIIALWFIRFFTLPPLFQLKNLRGLQAFVFTTVRMNWLSLIQLLLCLGFFALSLVPMQRSEYYAQSQQFRLSTSSVLNPTEQVATSNYYTELGGTNAMSRIFFHRWVFLGRDLIANYADHLNLKYLFFTSESNLRHSTGQHGLFLFTAAPFFFWGIYHLSKRKRSLGIVLILWWLIALLPASVPLETPHALRSLNALTPLSIIIGFGLAQAYQYWQNPLIRGGITVILLAHTAVFMHYYIVVYQPLSAEFWQKNARVLTEQVLSERVGSELVTVKRIEGMLYLWFLAYGEYDTHTIQMLPKPHYQLTELEGITFSEQTETRIKYHR